MNTLLNKQTIASLIFIFSLINSNLVLAANNAISIDIEGAYVREVPPIAPASASFMTLKNNSSEDIKLIGAASDVSEKVELHTHKNDSGMMKMRRVKNIDIPAKGITKLQPGGLHIMLIGLKAPLKAGQKIQLTLIFEDKSEKQLTLPVKSMKGMPMTPHQHSQ